MPTEIKRGPGYPAYGLSGAVARAKQLFDEHGKRQITAEEAVQTWGYKGLSGPSARALAGLRHYGLVEGTNNALRLSADALALIIEDDAADDRLTAMQRAAGRPRVFSELLGVFPIDGGLPSDGAIKAYLLKETDFGQTAASELVEAFKDTVVLAQLYKNPENEASKERTKTPSGASGGPMPAVASTRSEVARPARESQPGGWQGMNFAYTAAGSTQASLTITGSPPDEDAAAQIALYLDLVKSAILSEAKKATKSRMEGAARAQEAKSSEGTDTEPRPN